MKPPSAFNAILDRNHFPKCIRHFEEVKGIVIGKCVDGTDIFRGDDRYLMGHAHCCPCDEKKSCRTYRGFICLRHTSYLRDKAVLIHEVAHIIAKTAKHNAKWKRTHIKLGGDKNDIGYQQ